MENPHSCSEWSFQASKCIIWPMFFQQDTPWFWSQRKVCRNTLSRQWGRRPICSAIRSLTAMPTNLKRNPIRLKYRLNSPRMWNRATMAKWEVKKTESLPISGWNSSAVNGSRKQPEFWTILKTIKILGLSWSQSMQMLWASQNTTKWSRIQWTCVLLEKKLNKKSTQISLSFMPI